MKKTVQLLFICLLFLEASPVLAQQQYTCPMHPEVISSKPGKCPKCGMDLVSKQAPAKAASKPVKKSAPKTSTPARKTGEHYVCPMKCEGTKTYEQPGKCPVCGMELKKVSTAPAKKASGHNEGHAEKLPGGTNERYTPFTNYVAPVLKPTDPAKAAEIDLLSNFEHDVVEKPAEKVGAGTHFAAGTPGAKTVRYDLYVNDTLVNYTGKSRKAISVNGSIPSPTLTFTIGDTALIYVHNISKEPTALHWHGVMLPNRMDGVPYLTQQPIMPGSTHIYKFKVVQDGTYWYHSHFSLQEQVGVYGALIFNKRTEPDIPTLPLVLSDWSDMNPHEINRSLHAANDWFAVKKGATQSYSEAIKEGHFGTKLLNEWKRMTAMDVSDVYYERFLINGAARSDFGKFKAGDKIRLRVVNGGASSYFWLSWSGGKITVLANDGNDVEPVEVDRLIIGVSETYDLLLTIPDDGKYEFLATPEDRTNHASLWLGSGKEVPAAKLPRLNYFEGMKMMNGMMKMNGDMEPMGMEMSLQKMDMNIVMYPEVQTAGQQNQAEHAGHGASADLVTLNYDMLKATKNTTLPEGPWRELKFELTGNMNRYVWTLDDKTVSETDKILINKGENLRIILYNNSMMRHPMHLHGHDFRTVNSSGERSPMKNVIDIMPMETDTLEFHASESGDWFFHCHILYHMMSGMGRVFSYQNSPANPEIPDPRMSYNMLKMDDRMFYTSAQIGLESNGSEGDLTVANTRWQFNTIWHLGFNKRKGYEVEAMIGRYFGKMQWLMPYVGFDYHFQDAEPERNIFGQWSNKTDRKTIVAGVAYTLPWLVVADARVDGKGKFRFQLSREDIPLTPRLRLNLMGNSDREYMAGARYILGRYLSLSSHYDSDMGLGGGLTITY